MSRGQGGVAEGALEAALAGGRFDVAGSCVFDPSAPVHPGPPIHEPGADVAPLKAREEVRYRYSPR